MNLFQKGTFTLHSGQVTDFKIDCDALTDDDIECIAMLISKQVQFDEVYGVPEGGLRLAKALHKYARESKGNTILIVDDVLTTGASMEEIRKSISIRKGSEGISSTIMGYVIFARAVCPYWVKALLKMG